MPNRILKESICTSDTINALSVEEECFFYRLIVQCDDFGRMDARPNVIRGRCYPLRVDAITEPMVLAHLEALETAGLIVRYQAEGRPYLHMVRWEAHQNIRARKAKYPPPPPEITAPREHMMPTERDIEDALFGSLSEQRVFLGRPVISVQRQVRVGESYLDIVITTDAGAIGLELKRGRLSNKDVAQAVRYGELISGKMCLIGAGLAGNFDAAQCIESDLAVITYDEDTLTLTLAVPSSTVTPATFTGFHGISRDNKLASNPNPIQSESNRNPNPHPNPIGAAEAEEALASPGVPYSAIVHAYHLHCSSWPRVGTVTPARRQTMRQWWATFGGDLHRFELAFQRAAASDFLSGRNGRWKSDAPCDFDWLLKDSNLAAVLEGKYNNRQPRADPDQSGEIIMPLAEARLLEQRRSER